MGLQACCRHHLCRTAAAGAVLALAGCHAIFDFDPRDGDATHDAEHADGEVDSQPDDGAGDDRADVDDAIEIDADGEDDGGDIDGEDGNGDIDGEDDGETVEAEAGRCGDGTVDPGEECDNGTLNSDTEPNACRMNCRRAHCGDGVVDGREECDNGGLNSDTAPDACRTDCTPARCGDGVTDSGEACDDRNSDDTDACVAGCAAARCGDGFRWTGREQCDNGTLNGDTAPDACRTDCRTARCGDGVTDSGEGCDDGNRIDTDECRNDCTPAACGDGVPGPGEECDDGNRLNTDACLNTCRLATCGDGFIRTGIETCDGDPPQSCVTTCITSGTRACVGCNWAPECAPPIESCNGRDDDCDTACDNGYECCAGSPASACTTNCGTPGVRSCSIGCTFGLCCAPAEVCGNGCDDNCNGTPDEGCSACDTCPGATDIAAGGRFTGTLVAGPGTTSGSCGGNGAEAALAFTTGGVQDVFLSTHFSAFDTVLYVRRCGCDGAEVACNDDADGRNGSVLFLRDLPAGTYNVFVDAKTAAAGGAYQIDAYLTAPGPTGDRCGDPILIAAAGATGNNCDMAHDYTPGCEWADSGMASEVVYYFLVPVAATATFETCLSTWNCPAPPCVDTTLFIRSVCSNAGAQVVCNDDACGYNPPGANPPMYSRITTALTPGIYYLFMDAYPGTWACGDYRITVTGL